MVDINIEKQSCILALLTNSLNTSLSTENGICLPYIGRYLLKLLDREYTRSLLC